MKITMFSNFLNHHQLPFCEEMVNLTNGDFWFVATMPIDKERLSLGYEDMNQKEFVVREYEDDEQKEIAKKLCLESDVVIYGSAPEALFKERKEKGLLTFRYSERILKDGYYHIFSPRAQRNMRKYHSQYKNVYLLCASAFAAKDYALFGAYKNKAYKWGYFPEVKRYDSIDVVINKKKKNSILWVGRLIEWKHTVHAIEIAYILKKDGYEFTLNIIGTGELEENLQSLINKKGLQGNIKMLGSMPPEKVREYMEESEIFLFTSDRNEGWGAVINEAMNSGCAVVASHIIGSVPFLLENNVNGLIYKNGSIKDLHHKTKFLLDNSEKRKEIGKNAYLTIEQQWNPQNAAKRLYELSGHLLNNEDKDVFENGVCSKA